MAGKKQVPAAAFKHGASDSKRAIFGANADNYQTQRPGWQLGRMDLEGPWPWTNISIQVLTEEIHPKLRNFESMTWAEITAASGGRNSGTNSHSVEVVNLCKTARDRLEAIGQNDTSELFSLHSLTLYLLFFLRRAWVRVPLPEMTQDHSWPATAPVL